MIIVSLGFLCSKFKVSRKCLKLRFLQSYLLQPRKYLKIDFVTARLKMYDYSPSRNFYKTHVRQLYKVHEL